MPACQSFFCFHSENPEEISCLPVAKIDELFIFDFHNPKWNPDPYTNDRKGKALRSGQHGHMRQISRYYHGCPGMTGGY
jgi:hypothetical protein